MIDCANEYVETFLRMMESAAIIQLHGVTFFTAFMRRSDFSTLIPILRQPSNLARLQEAISSIVCHTHLPSLMDNLLELIATLNAAFQEDLVVVPPIQLHPIIAKDVTLKACFPEFPSSSVSLPINVFIQECMQYIARNISSIPYTASPSSPSVDVLPTTYAFMNEYLSSSTKALAFLKEQQKESKLHAFHFLRQASTFYIRAPPANPGDMYPLTYLLLKSTDKPYLLATSSAKSQPATCVLYGLLLSCLDVDLREEAQSVQKVLCNALVLSIIHYTREDASITGTVTNDAPGVSDVYDIPAMQLPSSRSSPTTTTTTTTTAGYSRSSGHYFRPSGLVLIQKEEDATIQAFVNVIAALLSDGHMTTRTLACDLLSTTNLVMKEYLEQAVPAITDLDIFCRLCPFYDLMFATLLEYMPRESWKYHLGVISLFDHLCSTSNHAFHKRILNTCIQVCIQTVKIMPEDAFIIYRPTIRKLMEKLFKQSPTVLLMESLSVINHSNRFHLYEDESTRMNQAVETLIDLLFTGSNNLSRFARDVLPLITVDKAVIIEGSTKQLVQINYTNLPLSSRLVLLRAISEILIRYPTDDNSWRACVMDLLPTVLKTYVESYSSLRVPMDLRRMLLLIKLIIIIIISFSNTIHNPFSILFSSLIHRLSFQAS